MTEREAEQCQRLCIKMVQGKPKKDEAKWLIQSLIVSEYGHCLVGVRRVVLAKGRPVRRYLLSGVRGSINSVTAVGCGALAVNGVVSAVDRCAGGSSGDRQGKPHSMLLAPVVSRL